MLEGMEVLGCVGRYGGVRLYWKIWSYGHTSVINASYRK